MECDLIMYFMLLAIQNLTFVISDNRQGPGGGGQADMEETNGEQMP